MQIAIRSKRNWFLFLSFAAITDVEASGKPPVMLLTDLSNAEIIKIIYIICGLLSVVYCFLITCVHIKV